MNHEDIKELLKRNGLINKPLIGCTEEEINQIESKIGLSLPGMYKEYLLAVGHESGRLFQGTHVSYASLVEIQEWTQELLEEHNNPIVLSKSTFVFSMHQGYAIRFFDVDMGDNPPVFEWYEGMEDPSTPIKIFDTFESFLLREIEFHANTNWID